MKLSDLSKTAIDLSAKPSSSLVKKLAKGDEVLYDGSKHTVEVPPKKFQRGIWLIGLESHDTGEPHYVKIYEDSKPNMTAHEKKTMTNNIKALVEAYDNDERGDEEMVRFIHQYHYNLSELNRFADEDVRECMSLFPSVLLKSSGVVV